MGCLLTTLVFYNIVPANFFTNHITLILVSCHRNFLELVFQKNAVFIKGIHVMESNQVFVYLLISYVDFNVLGYLIKLTSEL